MLKKIILTVVFVVLSTNLQAGIFEDVENINKGTDGYVIGKVLNKKQKELLETKGLRSDNPNVRKFLANENLLIAINSKNLKVLAINKRFQQIKQEKIKSLIGDMIHDYDEPTAMAHDKMLYWIYDNKGIKFSEDDIKKWKDSLKETSNTKSASLADFLNKAPLQKTSKNKKVEFKPYISVKLSSDQPMMTKQQEPKLANVYLMISSDKLITETTTVK